MVTVMVTVMAKMLSNKNKILITMAAGLVAHNTMAAEVKVSARASTELTYSDNINLSSTGEKHGIVSTWSAGTTSDINGNNGKMSFDYDVYQTIHSVDSDKNELFNELSFLGTKKFHRNNLTLNANASVTNTARSVEDNANADFISGDTIENRTMNAQAIYRTNPRGYFDFYGSVDGSVTSNEDDVGDFYSVGANTVFRNGTAVKDYFWLTDYRYNRNISNDTDNEYYDFNLQQELGLQPIKGFSPFIRVYYEGYARKDGDGVNDSGSWGPAIRYYWHKRSYIELSYDFSFKDRDFWRGAFRINPTPRTLVEFDYTRRFFGDAYDFSLTHQIKKLKNSIQYTEEVTAFDRTFFVEGEDIEEYQLSKKLSANSTVALKRSSITLEVHTLERTPLEDNDEIGKRKFYGGTISASHRLSSKSTLNGSYQYDRNVFNSNERGHDIDYYRIYDISLVNQLSESISWDVSLRHSNNSGYDENRANMKLSVVY